MVIGIISGVTYPVLLKGLQIVHTKPHYVHTSLMQSMLQMGCNAAKADSTSSLFLKLPSIHVVQKSRIANLLYENLQLERLGNLWGNELGVLPPLTRHDKNGAHPKGRTGVDQQKGDAHCGQQVVVTNYVPRTYLTHQYGQARHLSHGQHGLYCIQLC